MITPAFNDLAKGVNRHELLEHMKQQGWLMASDNGNFVGTKWISGRNVRGYGFTPTSWEGKAGRIEQKPQIKAVDVEIGGEF